MANISIRKFDDSIKQALQKRAAAEGLSMESLLRRVLAQAAAGENADADKAEQGGLSALSGKRVALIIGGSVASYKALELIRILRRAEATVQAVMTAAAQRFITPLAVGALTGGRVYTDLFSREDEQDIGHIRLARGADIIIFVGLSASRMAKMAAGLADDLAGAVLLAARAPVLAAPAMNPAMWAHPAIQRARAQLAADGCLFVGPERGEMAESGEAGLGRMSEAAAIAAAAAEVLAQMRGGAAKSLSGKHILITAGPTHEPLDPVRYLGNHSSGRQGYALAAALTALGARITLISGPVALPAPEGVALRRVETALEMQAAAKAALPADAAIFTAAVADWRPRVAAAQKIKKPNSLTAAPPRMELVENPDILAEIGHSAARPRLVIGFAAETDNLSDNAAAKLAKKGADWIVANNVARRADGSSVMGGANNQIMLLTKSGAEIWAEMPKEQVAAKLAAKIAAFFAV